MRKITKLFLSLFFCIGICFTAWASGYTMDDFAGAPPLLGGAENVLYYYYFGAKNPNPIFVRLEFDDIELTVRDAGGFYYLAHNVRELRYWVNMDDGWIYANNPSAELFPTSSSTLYESVVFLESTCDIKLSDGTLIFSGSGGGSGKQDYAYDSSIPAPKNLTFTTREEGGNFIIAGTKFYGLSWTPPVDGTLMCRIDANVTGKTTGQGGVSKTQYVRLAGENPDLLVSADSGKYEFTVGQIEDKIGGHLGKLDYLRLQYYRLKEGKIVVGPISTVRLKLGLFGKYTYVVTTEYPNDESDVGSSGGLDDTYHDKWTSDGENYYEYDQDGNLIDSGTNSTGSWSDALKGLIDSLLNIPTIITRLFGSLSEMMSGIGALPAYFAQVVTWLPSEITALISLGIVVVIALRIFGR